MCDKVYAEYACADKHESNGEERTRLKHIVRCDQAVQRQMTCHEQNMGAAHILQEDEPDEDCPECRGETPPESP
jgi:hypothetical protein